MNTEQTEKHEIKHSTRRKKDRDEERYHEKYLKVVIIWIINITYMQLYARNFVLSSVNDKTNIKYVNIMITHSEQSYISLKVAFLT